MNSRPWRRNPPGLAALQWRLLEEALDQPNPTPELKDVLQDILRLVMHDDRLHESVAQIRITKEAR